MSLRDKWKDTGKNIGGAFKNFGKAMATTAKVAVGKEDNSQVNEDGKTPLREAWTNTGKGFGKAGKSLGTAAAGTVDKVVGEEEEPKEKKKPNGDEVVDAKPVEEDKKD